MTVIIPPPPAAPPPAQPPGSATAGPNAAKPGAGLRQRAEEFWQEFRVALRSQPREVAVLIWALLTISALTAWLLAYVFLFSSMQEQRTNSVLYSQLRYGLSEATAPIGGVIAPGSPIALIQAPVDGLRSVVLVEGTAPTDLSKGPGHRRDTVLPGQAGVCLIYGRSLTYGAPLGHIDELRQGDKITVTTGQGAFTYEVDRVRHSGDPLPAPLASGQSRITFETSTGSGVAPNTTVFVDATLKGNVVDTPAGRVRVIPQDEKAMQGDTSHMANLVLWLQALIIVVLGIVWSWTRWGRWQTWLIGTPILLAVLWATTSNVMMMMPNLI
ncbi:sortase A [Frankineae bacterium MT45]|nr:sortase A [Frankineae bacterium MT45]